MTWLKRATYGAIVLFAALTLAMVGQTYALWRNSLSWPASVENGDLAVVVESTNWILTDSVGKTLASGADQESLNGLVSLCGDTLLLEITDTVAIHAEGTHMRPSLTLAWPGGGVRGVYVLLEAETQSLVTIGLTGMDASVPVGTGVSRFELKQRYQIPACNVFAPESSNNYGGVTFQLRQEAS